MPATTPAESPPTPSAGAQFGYQTLFLMVLITVALVVVQEMCARLGAYTGEGLGALIREQFSLRVTAFALLAFLLANIGLVVSEFAGIAAALELVGVSKYVSIPVAVAVIWALVVFGSYRYAERVFLILSLAFLAYPVAAVLARPDLAQAARPAHLAALHRQQGVPPARGGPDRHDHHPVHAVLYCCRGRR